MSYRSTLYSVLAVASLLSPISAAEPSFRARLEYPSGTLPRAICSADFDGDGHNDVATANRTSKDVSVLLNDGSGNLGVQSLYTIGGTCRAIFCSNFDGNSRPDIAVVSNDSMLSVLLNTGSGTFNPAVRYGTALPNPYVAMSGADFDGDSKVDIAVAVVDSGVGKIWVFTGNGDGTFAAPVSYSGPLNPNSLTCGQFNGDNRPDIAVATDNVGVVSVLLNNGDGTFATGVDYPLAVYHQTICSGDLTADGKDELIVTRSPSGGSGPSLSVLVNYGDGTFAAPTDYSPLQYSYGCSVADLDSDGDRDVVVSGLTASNNLLTVVRVLKNNGAGVLTAQPPVPTGSGAIAIIASDLGGNIAPDLATVSTQTNRVAVLLNDGSAGFTTADIYNLQPRPFSAVASDFDGNGSIDLATACRNSTPNGVSIQLNNGSGVFGAATTYSTGPGVGYPEKVVASNFNGDGDIDLAALNTDISGRGIRILINNGSGAFATGAIYADFLNDLCAADFDGDGKQDIAATSSFSPNIFFYKGNGDHTFGSPGSIPLGTSGNAIAAADFNGDGKPDLAVSAYGDSIALLTNIGGGAFASPTIYLSGAFPISMCTADFDGSGKPDVAVATSVGVIVFTNNGAGALSASPVVPVDGIISIRPGDFDGNAKPDLACSIDGAVIVLVNNGSGALLTAKKLWGVGRYSRSLAVADFSGDGKPDIATADDNSSTASVLINTTVWSCCIGLTGNVDCDPGDGTDISDLAALIDYLYISFTPLCCPAEANTDGQSGTDISDLAALIDYLYISFTPTAACQ